MTQIHNTGNSYTICTYIDIIAYTIINYNHKFYTILEPYYYRHKPIVLDLSTLSFSDNFGIVAFIERYQWSRVIKKEFRIKGLNKKNKKKIIMLGLSDFLDLDKHF